MLSQPADLEAIRRTYQPNSVSHLLVGESPPFGGTFFYLANSLLFRAVHQSFLAQVPHVPHGEEFLRWFCSKGWFVADLCHNPINHLPRRDRRQYRRRGEADLTDLIAMTRPLVIVSVLRGIEPNVRRALSASHHGARFAALPFPSHHHQPAFGLGLAEVISQWRRG